MAFTDFPEQTRPFLKGLTLSRRTEIKKNLKRKTPLPPQLQARVQSGRITADKARQTLQQRQTLKAAFGDDWRTQVFGKGGAKGLNGPFAPAQIRQKRSQALARAQKKLHGGLGSAKGVQGTLNAPTPHGIGPRVINRRRKRPY